MHKSKTAGEISADRSLLHQLELQRISLSKNLLAATAVKIVSLDAIALASIISARPNSAIAAPYTRRLTQLIRVSAF